MPTVFISHVTEEDGQFAHRLADDLRRLGVQVWIAPESIRPGEGWVKAIERGLAESSHMVVVLTPAALESTWVEKETEVAIARERRGLMQIIPLDVEPCEVPPLLSSYQMVYFRRDYGAGLSQLTDILGVRVPTPEPVRPPRQAPPHSTIPEAEAVPVEEVVSAEAVHVEEVEIPDWLRILREEGLEEPTFEEPRPLFELDMILIPAGEFLYGRKKKRVILPQFWIDETPVTNAEYARFVAQMGHSPPLHWEGKTPPKRIADHPVTRVSWHDAVAYAEWAGKRLPTEEEWEKAARGSDGREYPWGDRFDPNRCNTRESGIGKTTPVGQYSPQGDSPYGCVDMAGNVWEWTASDYDKSNKVLRGGSWDNYQGDALCAHRGRYSPLNWYISVGFRCALR
jgi:sulfatase modifying factor 1